MKKSAFIYIALAGLLWGTSVIFVHFLAPIGFSSQQMTAMRGVVSLLALLIYIFFTYKELFKIKKSYIPFFIGAGITMNLTATCYYFSMQASSPSTAVVLMYSAPVFVMIYSVLFMGEKLTTIKTMSVFFMIVGCGLVSGIIGGLKFSFWGILIGFVSGLTYSAYNIITKLEMKKSIHPLTATFYCYVFMALSAVLISNPSEIISITMQNPALNIPLVIGVGIFTSVLPYFLYTLGLKALPAGTASALGIIEPLAATVYSVIFFSEPLSLASIIGIVLILGATVMLSRSEG